MRWPRLAFLLVIGVVVACSGRRGGGGGDDDDDADGDADADSDADADGDGDGDADPPVCALGCPAGYSCTVGVCEGGDPEALILDVPSVAVSGNVTVNGARPSTGPDCEGCPDCGKASIGFVSEAGASFSTFVPCSSTGYAFDLDVAPGTYAVSVYGYGERYSDLPSGTAALVGALRVP